jgi:hypothetical protein
MVFASIIQGGFRLRLPARPSRGRLVKSPDYEISTFGLSTIRNLRELNSSAFAFSGRVAELLLAKTLSIDVRYNDCHPIMLRGRTQ